ncbi:MAG: DMT family transporter, partial [Candidatus Methanomethylophilaceae archaeon]
VSKTLWAAILLVTVSSILLSVDDISGFVLSPGALLVLGACFCWGMENNCTRRLSEKDPIQITTVKGIFSGLGSMVVALYLGDPVPGITLIPITLVLGFLSYGLSISSYIRAQRDLGASRVSAYYSLAPFIGVAIAFILFRETLGWSFWIALLLMVAGTLLVTMDALRPEVQTIEDGKKMKVDAEPE